MLDPTFELHLKDSFTFDAPSQASAEAWSARFRDDSAKYSVLGPFKFGDQWRVIVKEWVDTNE